MHRRELNNHRLSPVQEIVITQMKGLDLWGGMRNVKHLHSDTCSLASERKEGRKKRTTGHFQEDKFGHEVLCCWYYCVFLDNSLCMCTIYARLRHSVRCLLLLHAHLLLLQRDKDEDQEDDCVEKWPDIFQNGPKPFCFLQREIPFLLQPRKTIFFILSLQYCHEHHRPPPRKQVHKRLLAV